MARIKDEVSLTVGAKIRELRKAKGLPQTAIAVILGVSHQQFAKYEWGINRIPCCAVYLLADYFEVNINDFFASAKDLN